ncbi:MAG: zinc ABC transporter substrate-binding protein [Rubellimicrobium sp.]|nr:zinc ABC transporter substrate-binding protein [Rubellimicrobium sp.]
MRRAPPALLPALLLALAPAALPATEAPLDVVASFSIIGDLAQAVGGDRIALHTIIGPGTGAHDYEPRPADALALAAADVVLVNGFGLEHFLDRLIEASGTTAPVAVLGAGIEPLRDAGGTPDPHAWLAPANVRIYTGNIAAAFCAADAAGCADYERNARAFDAVLAALDAEIRASLDAIPAGRRIVAVPHAAFAYFGAAYGVRFLAPQGITPDAEASAADVAALIRAMRAGGVTAVFAEAGENPALITRIAAEAGARVAGVLYADALSGPEGPAASYVEMMRHNADAIAGALAD